jgi:hypothetical protein
MARVDTQLALLLAALTRANATPMMAVYSVLRRATGRYDAISAAARVSVDTRGQALVSAILAFCEYVEGNRNDLAHGHWGISRLIPEGILWIDGTYAVSLHVEHRQKLWIQGTHFNADVTKEISYYTINNFHEILKDMRQLCEILFLFRAHFDTNRKHDVFAPSDALCARIESFSPIRQALSLIDGYVLQPTRPKPAQQQKAPPI